MVNRMQRWWLALMVLLLAACGGGGGGSGGGGGGGGVGGGGSLLSFEPETIEATYVTGSSVPLTVRGTINNIKRITGDLYIYVEDSQGILNGSMEFLSFDEDTLEIRAATSPSLKYGNYDGELLVHLCQDMYCNSKYGEATPLPYSVRVTPLPLAIDLLSDPEVSYTVGDPVPANLQLAVKIDEQDWTLRSSAAWLVPVNASGSGHATADLAVNPTGLGVGSYSAVLTVQTADEQTATTTVTLQVSERRLLPSVWGIALTSSTKSRLSASVNVSVDSGAPVGWTATSDSPWLTVTQSGQTGDSLPTLAVQANPASLPDNQVSYARVTIASTHAGVQPAVVRVGLWKGATTSSADVNLEFKQIVADPIRPFVYVHNGGATVDVYNVHTAQRVARLSGVASRAGAMAVSPDGSKLYIEDGDEVAAQVRIFDLDARRLRGGWTRAASHTVRTQLLVIRPRGKEVVLASNGQAFVAGGTVIRSDLYGRLAASSDSRWVYTLDNIVSPSQVTAYAVDYHSVTGTLSVEQRALGGGAGNGSDIAVGPLGVVTASGGHYSCELLMAHTLAPLGNLVNGSNPYPNNAEVSATGQTLCGIDGVYADYDFWVYDSDGSLIKAYKVAGSMHSILEYGLIMSSDGLMSATLTSDPKLALRAVPR